MRLDLCVLVRLPGRQNRVMPADVCNPGRILEVNEHLVLGHAPA
jgi:hypothetical protein